MSVNYECKICTKKFKSYYSCYRHESNNKCTNLKYSCIHCSSRFKHNKSLIQHISKSCKIMKENRKEREKEHEEIKQVKEQLNLLSKRMEEKDKEIELLKQSKSQNINIEGNMNNIHLHINPYGQEKLDNINTEEIVKMLISYINPKDYNLIIPNMVKKINIDVNENKNTYITNIRSNYGLILDNGDWNHIEMDRLLNDLMIDNMDRATEYISNNKELFTQYISISKYHDLKYSLDLYFNKSIDKTECMKKIKDILIANRNLVSSFYEGITGQKIKLSK